MRKLTNSIADKLRNGFGRVRRMRRGSVLIIVVALLVMMALIGTAAITTARLDRYAARQQVTTVENEIIREAMLQRARNDAINALARDNTGTMDSPYILNNTGTTVRVDPALASRVPELLAAPLANTGTLDATSVCFWPALSRATPAAPTTQFASGYKPFEDILLQGQYGDYNNDNPVPGRVLQTWVPGSVRVTYPANYPDTIMQNKVRVFPAFYGVSNLDGTGTYNVVLAGDADGDGVADCGMYRLTDTPIRGEYFYVGIRIVDNNSAINPQVAWSRDHDYDGTGTKIENYGMFGGNVGFIELLAQLDFDKATESALNTPVTNLNQFNNYRFNTGTTALGASDTPVRVADSVTTTPAARTDYHFDSQAESKNSGLDIRMKVPTFNRDSDGNGTFENFQVLPLSDATAFAFKNNFVNPNGSQGQLAKYLPYSLRYSAPNYTLDPSKSWRYFPANPFDPAGTTNVWWDELNVAAGTLDANNKPRTIRQLVETLNPTLDVTKTMQIAQFDWNRDGAADDKDEAYPGMLPNTLTKNTGTWTAGTNYVYDTIVQANATNTPSFSYIASVDSAGANTGHNPFTAGNPTAAPDFWEYQPYVSGNAPTSLNTATFRELFRTYYNVIAEDGNSSKLPTAVYGGATGWQATVTADEGGTAPPDLFNPTTGTDGYNPFRGREWQPTSVNYEPKRIGNIVGAPYEENALRMFTNVVRDVRGGADDATAVAGTPSVFPGPSPFTAANKSMRLNPNQMMVLRSAIASINLLGLRDDGRTIGGTLTSNNVLSRTVTLYETPTITAAAAASPPPRPRFQATVFSTARQPYITEVVAYNTQDPATMPYGYVAIELHNPYPVAINVSNWQIASLDRRNPRSPTMTVNPPYRYPVGPAPGVAPGGTPPAGATLPEPPNDWANMVYRPLTVPAGFTAPGIPAGTTIPAGGYLVLENYRDATLDALRPASDGKDATVRPGGITMSAAATAVHVWMPHLHEVITDNAAVPPVPGSEFVLLRPRRGDGVTSASADWYNGVTNPYYDTFAEEPTPGTPNLSDWIPIDSFDFSGLMLNGGTAAATTRLHYARASHLQGDLATAAAQWHCVYPGRYNGNEAFRRHQGTEQVVYGGPLATPEPLPVVPFSLGGPEITAQSSWELPATTPLPSPDFPGVQNFTIPLAELDWPGYNGLINPTTGVLETAPYKWPYGGFARVGDVMKIPYIGAYVLREVEPSAAGSVPAGQPDRGVLLGARFGANNHIGTAVPILDYEYILEANAVTMDAMFAEDTSTGSNATEDVGRFCPKENTYYSWADDILNAFTVTHNHADDYMPNFNPIQYFRLTNEFAQRVGNDGASPDVANEGNDDAVPTHGLVNINTAPVEVLDMVPMVVDAAGAILEPDNLNLAKAIVAHRSDPSVVTKGPFKTLFDLNKVFDTVTPANGFQNAMGHLNFTGVAAADDPSNGQGDFSPYNTPMSPRTNTLGPIVGPDGARNDFEERYLQISRLSNLLTVRSDSFNVYVLVQSWKNIGGGATTPPMLTWEKRIAFTADRSSVDPTTKARTLKLTDVPAD